MKKTFIALFIFILLMTSVFGTALSVSTIDVKSTGGKFNGEYALINFLDTPQSTDELSIRLNSEVFESEEYSATNNVLISIENTKTFGYYDFDTSFYDTNVATYSLYTNMRVFCNEDKMREEFQIMQDRNVVTTSTGEPLMTVWKNWLQQCYFVGIVEDSKVAEVARIESSTIPTK